MTKDEILSLNTEGNRGLQNLCKVACAIGYTDPTRQLINNDGSCVGDLLCFLEDNPGAIDALLEWITENMEECDNCGCVCIDAFDCRNGKDGKGGCEELEECEECGEIEEDCKCGLLNDKEYCYHCKAKYDLEGNCNC